MFSSFFFAKEQHDLIRVLSVLDYVEYHDYVALSMRKINFIRCLFSLNTLEGSPDYICKKVKSTERNL